VLAAVERGADIAGLGDHRRFILLFDHMVECRAQSPATV
jgi:hypothetical protein